MILRLQATLVGLGNALCVLRAKFGYGPCFPDRSLAAVFLDCYRLALKDHR